MPVLKIDMPEGAFSAIRKCPSEFTDEMWLATAVKWYEMGMIPQKKAAEVAGISRAEFIFPLTRFRVTPFQYSVNEVVKELRDDQ